MRAHHFFIFELSVDSALRTLTCPTLAAKETRSVRPAVVFHICAPTALIPIKDDIRLLDTLIHQMWRARMAPPGIFAAKR